MKAEFLMCLCPRLLRASLIDASSFMKCLFQVVSLLFGGGSNCHPLRDVYGCAVIGYVTWCCRQWESIASGFKKWPENEGPFKPSGRKYHFCHPRFCPNTFHVPREEKQKQQTHIEHPVKSTLNQKRPHLLS